MITKRGIRLWCGIAYVVPGVIDEEAKFCFTSGQCHALALAIHNRTGWGLVGAYRHEYCPSHILIRHPSGRLLDIEGLRKERDLDFWGEFKDMTREEVEALSAGDYWAADLDNANDFVDVVLDSYCANVLV